jgi:hypothetical protein
MGKTKKWPGQLGKRIPLAIDYSDSGFDPEVDREIEEKKIFRARVSKLPLLFGHFKIDRAGQQFSELSAEHWFKLALAVAIECVPGFKLKKRPAKRGPKATWRPVGLIFDVELYIAEKEGKASVREAIAEAQKMFPEWYGSYHIDVLIRRYYETRKRYAAISPAIAKACELTQIK